MIPNLTISDRLLLAAELEDPNVPEELIKEVGSRYPPFTKECWELLREYGLLQPGYMQTEAQILAFCLASILANEKKPRK
jgi:hypothetical protein